jgi:hypothetical protein
MTRLTLWLAVGCTVVLVAGGTSFAPAAETESAAATDEEATLTRADLEVRKAEVRVRYAEANLADAKHRVAEGLISLQDIRVVERELEEAQLALMEAQLAAQEWESQKVTVEFKEAPLDDALRLIFRRTPYSYVLSPEIGRLALEPLSIRLKEVDLQTVVRVICDTYDLLYRKDDSVYYFFPRSDVVTIGGVRVPLIGAVSAEESYRSLFEAAKQGTLEQIASTPRPGPEQKTSIEFSGSHVLVDLEVADAPLAEVATQLSDMVNAALARETARNEEDDVEARRAEIERRKARQLTAPGSKSRNSPSTIPSRRVVIPSPVVAHRSEVQFIAHDSLKDVRVTAKVYRWPAGEVVGMLIDQADLVYTKEHERTTLPPATAWQGEDGSSVEVIRGSELTRIYLVPRPHLSVAGPGLPPDVQSQIDVLLREIEEAGSPNDR